MVRGVAALIPKKGIAEVDFGAFPGGTEATVAVALPGVGTSGPVVAWVQAKDTADHSADEHWAESVRVTAGGVELGVGFTIYATAVGAHRLYGKFTVGWAYFGT
jgi:hypothetical protein